jgi:uncharacterized protein DUF3168
MSGSPAWALQQALYTRLSGDTALVTTLGADVYDHVPDAAAFPYVVIGNVTEGPRDTMGRTGRDLSVTIHVWSQYPGMKQVKEIQSRVDELLDRWAPTVTGWSATQMQQEFFETFMDQDGITRHGVSRYGVHIDA